MRLTAKTDVGCVRRENQDDYRAAIQSPGNAWMVICDGMGGANGGQTASSLAVELAQQRCLAYDLAHNTPQESKTQAGLMIEEANAAVYSAAQHDPALHGMGTTMIVALVHDGVCSLASVGDSRAYLYRDGALQQLTRDHSKVQEMVEKGILTPQEANDHPQKNIITRAVGIETQVMVDVQQLPLQTGDILLLCTDGLTNMLDNAIIEGILRSATFYDSAGRLVSQVLQRGAPDNTTVVLLQVE